MKKLFRPETVISLKFLIANIKFILILTIESNLVEIWDMEKIKIIFGLFAQ